MTVQPDETVADVARQTATDPEIDDVNEAIAFMTDVLAGQENARQRMTRPTGATRSRSPSPAPSTPPPWPS